MVTWVVETGKTFGELCEDTEVKEAWDDYCTQSPDACEPKERWQLYAPFDPLYYTSTSKYIVKFKTSNCSGLRHTSTFLSTPLFLWR